MASMSASVFFNQTKDISFTAWLCALKLKISFCLREAYRYMNSQANAWLKVGLSVRTSLPAVPFTSKKGNKHAVIMGLITFAAVILTWKSHKRKLRPSAPEEIEESIASTIQKDCQSDDDENLPAEKADLKDTTVFDERPLKDPVKNTASYQILFPVSASLQPQLFDNSKQEKLSVRVNTLAISPTIQESWDKSLPNRFSETQVPLGNMRQIDSQVKLDFEFYHKFTTSIQEEMMMDSIKPDSKHKDQLPNTHHKAPKEEKEPYTLSNFIEHESVESRIEDLSSDPHALCKNCKTELTLSWTTPLEFPLSLTTSYLSSRDMTSTIKKFPMIKSADDLVARRKTNAGLHSITEVGMCRPFSHYCSENELGRNVPYISCPGQSSQISSIAGSVTCARNYSIPSVPTMGRDWTDMQTQCEKGFSLSHSIDVIKTLDDNAHNDSEPWQNPVPSFSHKLEQATQQRLHMYELVDDGDRSRYNTRHSEGYYQEKLRTYDKYLADPKLSAQMRSQVQRAKAYLQSYFENDN